MHWIKQMMNRKTLYALPLAALMLLFALGCSDDDDSDPVGPGNSNGDDDTEYAHVRAAHMAGGGSSGTSVAATGQVDVYADGELAISGVSYQDISGYVQVEAGTSHEIEVVETGTTNVVASGTMTAEAGKTYTFAVVESSGSAEIDIVEDDRPESNEQGWIRVMHSSEGAMAVDLVTEDNVSVASDLSFRESTSYKGMEDGSYNIQVRAHGESDVMMTFESVNVSSGSSTTLWISEPSGGSDASMEAVVSADGDASMSGSSTKVSVLGSAKTMVRAANFIPVDALLDVDLTANLASDLGNNQVSGYMEVDAKTHLVVLRDAITGTALASVKVTFTSNTHWTVLGGHWLDGTNAPRIRILEDGDTGMNGDAAVRFVHESPDSERMNLVDASTNTVLFSSVEYQDHTQYDSIEPGTYDMELRGAVSGETYATMNDVEFSGDASYSIVARGSSSADDVEGQKVRDAGE